MGHIKYRSKTRAEATDPTWYAVGSQIGQLSNIMSGRSDLIAYVGPGAGGIAPACYTPATAEIEINVDVAFGKGVTPADIGDLRERETQFMWPKAMGAIFHEALHARYSNWDIEKAANDLSRSEFFALLLLEEGRIEAQGLAIMPENAGFLRATALEIVLADLAEEGVNDTDTRMAARLAALALARVDAGSILEEDCTLLRESIVAKLGEARLEKLRQLWIAAQMHTMHFNAEGMYDLAREWVRIVEEAADENGEPGEGEAGDAENGSGGMSTMGSEFISDIMEALKDAADAATVGSFEQLGDQQQIEEWREEAKDRANESRREQECADVAQDVFSKGTGEMATTASRSSLVEQRAATGPERAAAVKVASLLEKAKYRERDEVEIHSTLPPGRLRTRAMVQGAALKSKGVMQQAEPWRRTVRKHTDDPKLTLGVMVDISGSMSDAMQPMATTAWVMSEAVRRVQGRAAMVYYGQDVFPTLKPGQHLDKVAVYTAPDGTEKFDRAFKAINGGLNLLRGTGARLLVIVSDGCYVNDEKRAARRWLEECKRSGVGVLWLTFDRGDDAQPLIAGTDAVLLTGITKPEDVAVRIGSAAAKALEAVN